jgi:hypothetical protein
MQNIVAWEYYNSLSNLVSFEDFERAEALAEKEVRYVIGYRWHGISEDHFYFNQLKDCICEVIDKMHRDKLSGIGNGIASVSNDGYSETYNIQTEFDRITNLRTCIRLWLSGTGLVGAY